MLLIEDIFLLSVQMLLGISLILLLLATYLWYVTKDKIIGIYGICLLVSICLAVVKLVNIFHYPTAVNVMENNTLDELIKSILGLAYIYFFGIVFEFNTSIKRKMLFWKANLILMSLQISYLFYLVITGEKNYFIPIITPVILFTISFVSLVLVVFVVIKKNKSRFQKIILIGMSFFFMLVLVGNLSEYLFKIGKSGFNMLFFALIFENIFFAIASVIRLKNIYRTNEKIKTLSFQQQIETEQIINYFTATIGNKNSTDELLTDVSKNLIGKLGFEDCMIYLWNADKTMLLQKAGYGIKGEMKIEYDLNKYHIPSGKGIVGAAAEGQNVILVNDTTLDPRYFTIDNNIRLSELCVPIVNNNVTLGVINTEHSQKNFYTQRHLQIITTIASLCADKIDKINVKQQSKDKEMEVLRLNKNLAESQLTALRAQMNPHFIFNALNSVQQYVLQGNVLEANKYLSKFSKLQREVLNNSNQDFVTLEKELEMLNLYLELEQLRFAERFSFKLTCNEMLDPDEIKIPPMIVQPFVENSIWHGLMTKNGERFVHINFNLVDDEQLVCTIRDNGIGREAAARLRNNNGSSKEHNSKGLTLIQDRLNILEKQFGKKFTVTIQDIFDNKGNSDGTMVILNIYTGF